MPGLVGCPNSKAGVFIFSLLTVSFANVLTVALTLSDLRQGEWVSINILALTFGL